MAFDVYLGNTTKRLNSTLVPSTDGWLKLPAVWKKAKDIDNPTITLFYQNEDYPQWNYMYIPTVNGYFWITSIVSVRNNTWEVSGAMDVLATYKSEIVDTQCYIEYGFNTDASGNRTRLRDSRQNVAESPVITTKTVAVPAKGVLSKEGTYILSVIGTNGSTLTFGLTYSQLGKLVNQLSQDADTILANLTTIEDIVKYLTRQNVTQGSAFQAIRNCTWLPVSMDAIEWQGRGYIWLGDYDTGVLANNTSDGFIVTSTSEITIPWPVSDWRRMNCQISLYIPYVGTVAVPVDQCNTASSLIVTWTCEILSGGVCLRIETDTGYTVYTGSSSIGSPYAIGSSNVPINNFVNGSITAIGGALESGGGILSAIANPWDMSGGLSMIASGATNAARGYLQSITPVVQCAGSLGSSAAYGQSQMGKLTLLYYPPIDDASFSTIYGHPVMAIGKPRKGYCKTRGFSVRGNMRGSEKSAIAYYMDNGTFIE